MFIADVELPSAPFKSTIDLLLYGVKRKYVLEEFDLQPFREKTFVPTFYAGKEYVKKHAVPLEIKEAITVKPDNTHKVEDDDFTTSKVKWDFPF